MPARNRGEKPFSSPLSINVEEIKDIDDEEAKSNLRIVGLAQDRTSLANERTLLAYVRTSLAFFILGAFIIKFLGDGESLVLGSIVVVLGAVILAIGIRRFYKFKKH